MKICLKLTDYAFSSSPSKDATMSTFCGFSSLFVEVKPFDELFPSKMGLQISPCVCVHPLNKDVSQAIIGTFFSAFYKR